MCWSATESEILPLVSDIYTQWFAFGQSWFFPHLAGFRDSSGTNVYPSK